MKIILGIVLILILAAMSVLIVFVSYLLWDEVCETYTARRKEQIAAQRLKEEIDRVCSERTDCSWR